MHRIRKRSERISRDSCIRARMREWTESGQSRHALRRYGKLRRRHEGRRRGLCHSVGYETQIGKADMMLTARSPHRRCTGRTVPWPTTDWINRHIIHHPVVENDTSTA